jgi:hypothetical protein
MVYLSTSQNGDLQPPACMLPALQEIRKNKLTSHWAVITMI